MSDGNAHEYGVPGDAASQFESIVD